MTLCSIGTQSRSYQSNDRFAQNKLETPQACHRNHPRSCLLDHLQHTALPFIILHRSSGMTIIQNCTRSLAFSLFIRSILPLSMDAFFTALLIFIAMQSLRFNCFKSSFSLYEVRLRPSKLHKHVSLELSFRIFFNF